MKTIDRLLETTQQMNHIYHPQILRLNAKADKDIFDRLFADGKVSFIHDNILGQLRELIKCSNPSIKIEEDEYPKLIDEKIGGTDINHYGVWVYYPWSQRLVHLLDEEEFIEVRTNRNRNKITKEEQKLLQSKKVGIVGLSVGQSIALTLAMERTCGEIRLADFDDAELSNLNRIRTGLFNLGLNKTVIAAREIMEIDPFLKVSIYSEGLTEQNMDDFFNKGGLLDLFVEVCDGLEVKLASRFKAKKQKIPVVMDTNDRGMLDVERFDLEPNRSIFHGMLDAFIQNDSISVTFENRTQILMSILSYESLSERMRKSMEQINKTINTWPQLASSVVLGGAITTDICRKILLREHSHSGRFYVDLDEIFETKMVSNL
jgi:hypothetical protein